MPRVAVMLDLESAYWRHVSQFSGLQQYADDHGWEVVIDEYADDTIPADPAQSSPYEGVIARATKKLADRAARHQLALVNVWLNSPVRDSLPGVFPDFREAGRLRAEHLMSRGHVRFAAIGCKTAANELETAAFRERLAESGFRCPETTVALSPSQNLKNWRATEQRLTNAMNSWVCPIGIHVAQEIVGRMLVQLCHARGWHVPGDVSIIAGFNEATVCEQPRPSLTSVELGGERIGYEAARMLHRLIDRKLPPDCRDHLLLPPSGLVVRESTDFVAVDDEQVAVAMTFIAANCHRKIGVGDVAKAVGMELRSLQKRFREVLDRPIATEIRRVRVERAKRELTQTDRSLSQIARDTGFGEAMRMYEVFRRELHCTPSQYRKQRQLAAKVSQQPANL